MTQTMNPVMNHKYTMVIQWSEEDRLYLVHLPEFPWQEFVTHGSTYEEAGELPALNWSTSMRGASKIEGNRLDSSRLTPILFWSYIASFGSNAGSQRQ
jgi:hypothetical protein